MSPGCLLTLSPSGQVLSRQPCGLWPKPEQALHQQKDGTWAYFLPVHHSRFHIGDRLIPFPFPFSPSPALSPMMKTLLRNVPLTLKGSHYTADILLGLYVSSFRPAIILVESRPDELPGERAWYSEPIALASTLSPPEYLQHLPLRYFPAKVNAENTGLWEQLLALESPEGGALFLPTVHKVTLGLATSPIMKLGPAAFHLYNELVSSHLQEIPHHG